MYLFDYKDSRIMIYACLLSEILKIVFVTYSFNYIWHDKIM